MYGLPEDLFFFAHTVSFKAFEDPVHVKWPELSRRRLFKFCVCLWGEWKLGFLTRKERCVRDE
jgi:hypothetical protein